MKYLLDTNILLIYLRNQKTKDYIDQIYQPFSLPNLPLISVVTKGEIKSIGLQNKWSLSRLQSLDNFLNQLIVVDINAEDIIEKYAEIDAFSQGKLTTKPLGMTSRNMGKNDLWIAATAFITDSKLMTMDADFDHLKDEYLELIKVELIK
jgi:predicted nucleic acid-binding protein